MPSRRVRLAVYLAALVVAGGCDTSQSLISGNQRLYAYSWTEEVALGQEADPEISEEMGIYDDPALTAYVARVGAIVLAESHVRRPDSPPEVRATPFTFRVLDSPDINAFALPGGYVYVTRGLLAHLGSEAELAVVLGHEVGHIAGRHASQRMLEAGLVMVGAAGAGLVAELIKEDAGQYVMAAGMLGGNLFLMGHSRGHESESDRLGVEYAAKAGYRAADGAGPFATFRRLRERDGGLPTFLSTHPDPGQREETIRQLAAEWAARGVRQDRDGAADFLAMIDGVVLGPDPRQGYVEDGVYVLPPAALRFEAPAGWTEVLAPRQVAFALEGGQAMLQFKRRAETTARAAVAQMLTDHGMTAEDHGAASVGGRVGYVATARLGETDDALRARIWAVERPDGVWAFLGAAAPSEFARHDDVFDRAARTLTTASRAEVDVEPARLRVVRADRSGPFRTFLPATLPEGLTDSDLAILNGVDLDEVVVSGRALKLPRP
ncbi:M48 family metalloprotease [Rubrivirga sp. IMCC45206]|uniref:M48 family metalloprotease n=1 Tax=Rubrivirga sp. IMCC45206 TaxID=3391614 RepID=UPI0039901CBA